MATRINLLARWLNVVGILVLSLTFVTGCTVGSAISLRPQSHFDYPNSNVTPLGRVQAEGSTVNFLFPVVTDADLREEVIQKALKQKGGDILIDYLLKAEISSFLFFYTTTYKVEGTAAKMVVGKKTLQ